MAVATPRVLWFEELDAKSVHLVGGKCASLGELKHAGVRVPEGFAVTSEAHAEFLASNGLAKRILPILQDLDYQDVSTVDDASAEIRSLIEGASLPDETADAIHRAYQKLKERVQDPDLAVAVRSSATAEDHYTASFAGQLETYLWIRGEDEVVSHVLRCWSGLFTPHALSYRRQMGFRDELGSMSVGVQQMVDARSAGVMFTMNPVNGDRSKVMIEACWGLGEGVVKGDVNPDRFLIDKVTFQILERTVSEKHIRYAFDPGAGSLAAVPVEEEQQGRPSISDDEVEELVRLGRTIERHYGCPQDIEWAIGKRSMSDDSIHVLQSRAETVWSQREPQPVIATSAEDALDHVIKKMSGGDVPSFRQV
jgi:pyruvate,water dikinase